MKLKIGKTTTEVEFFTDDGTKVIIPCQRIRMDLGPCEPTTVDLLGVYLDSVEMEMMDDEVKLDP